MEEDEVAKFELDMRVLSGDNYVKLLDRNGFKNIKNVI